MKTKKQKVEKKYRIAVCSCQGAASKISGGDDEGDPPVPIPNTEVKPFGADGTWLETARESRKLPDPNNKQAALIRSGLFCVCEEADESTKQLNQREEGNKNGSSRKVGGLLNIKAGQLNFRERINAENAHLSFITFPLMAKL